MDEAARKSSSQIDEQEQRPPEEIRRDIEQTRGELGDTAEALAQKADPKGQATAKAEGIKRSAQEKAQKLTAQAKDAAPESIGSGAHSVAAAAQENPVPVAIAGAFAAGLLVGVILSR
jgi:ElaB/YqjD/DUF883 family membrane-anchored ribosome-binding protein